MAFVRSIEEFFESECFDTVASEEFQAKLMDYTFRLPAVFYLVGMAKRRNLTKIALYCAFSKGRSLTREQKDCLKEDLRELMNKELVSADEMSFKPTPEGHLLLATLDGRVPLISEMVIEKSDDEDGETPKPAKGTESQRKEGPILMTDEATDSMHPPTGKKGKTPKLGRSKTHKVSRSFVDKERDVTLAARVGLHGERLQPISILKKTKSSKKVQKIREKSTKSVTYKKDTQN